MKFLKNEQLPTIHADWRGNPFRDGQFRYPEHPFSPSWNKLLRWQLTPNPQKAEKKADDWRPPVYGSDEVLSAGGDFISWLGHATFLIQLNGIRLITDPVLFDLPFLSRFVHPPFPADAITGLDYILLSHDHRDHCDQRTLKTLLQNNRPRKILTALKMSEVVGSWADGTPIEEAAWFQQYRTVEDLEVIYLPARHWCRRGLFDFNRRLWGSFLIRTGAATIYFGADSGYAGHFREIGERFPCIDIAVIGIGAYRPGYMMEEIHTSPEEAFQAWRDLGAKRLLPMHHGTYDLSDEPISEPSRRIRRLFEEAGEPERLLLPRVGEPVRFKE